MSGCAWVAGLGPANRHDAQNGHDGVDKRGEVHDDDGAFDEWVGEPSHVPAWVAVALLTGRVEQHHGDDRHNGACEAAGVGQSGDEATQAEQRDDERREGGERHGDAALAVGAFPVEDVEDVAHRGEADGEEGCEHRSERKDVGEVVRDLAERLAPGDGDDLSDVHTEAAERGKGYKCQGKTCDNHASDEGAGGHVRLGRIHARDEFRNDVLREEREHGEVEDGDDEVGRLNAWAEDGPAAQDGNDQCHTDRDGSFRSARGMKTAVHHPRVEGGEDEGAQGGGDAKDVGDDVAGTGGVSDECADAVDNDGDEYEPASPLAEVVLGETGDLQRLARAHGGLGDVEHGNCGERASDEECDDEREEAAVAGGIRNGQNTGADVGAEDEGNALCERQSRFAARCGASCVVVGFSGVVPRLSADLTFVLMRAPRSS